MIWLVSSFEAAWGLQLNRCMSHKKQLHFELQEARWLCNTIHHFEAHLSLMC